MVAAVVLAALGGCLVTALLFWLSRRAVWLSPGQAGPAVKAGEEALGEAGAESCHFLNAMVLFVFRELRDTAELRRWLLRKVRVELEELLVSRTAGRLLEGLSVRELSLGEAVPELGGIRLLSPEPAPEEPPELSLELELDYAGGFRLAIDVELLFGKSAFLSVRLARLRGRVRLVLSRLPFTHWSVCFLEEPIIDLQVHSQLEGRPMSQLTAIIVTQLKRAIRKKHTYPNYKIRYKPFFPYQVQKPNEEQEERSLTLQDLGLAEGRLRVSLMDCSRLLIFGSYDQETYVHCTLEVSSAPWKEKTRSSIKTVELMKGACQNIGLILALARDGDTAHICVESVMPNSPAAGTDLRKGDRLIAIGDIKVTSSVQAFKLIKQAGDKVLLQYERPAGQNQGGENLGVLEDSAFPQAFEDDPAGLLIDAESKELDSEFEDLAGEVRPPGETKDDIFLPVTQSPKRAAANLSTKSLGSISPILSRKPNNQTAAKTPAKPGRASPPDNQEPTQLNRTSSGSGVKPPVPPRPQVKLTLTTCDAELSELALEKADKAPPPPTNGDRPTEKSGKPTEKSGKPTEVVEELPKAKAEAAKDRSSEGSGSTRESLEEQNAWESPETLYRNRHARWPRASCTFDIENQQRYLNVALWCRDAFKTGGLCCVGHVSIKLEDISLECLCTSSLEYHARFRLNPPEPKASVSRTALRSLSLHKGFNEKLCYGDVTIAFKYLMEGDSENASMVLEKDAIFVEETTTAPKEDPALPTITFSESKHNFQDTQFQNSTLCDHCKRKVWTKAASQCMNCGYVCHKKCQEKCLAENPFCAAAERRADLEAKSVGNRTAGITRHIINTSSRLLNLRQAPKTRQAEQGSELAEPSPKQTPNTSDNESSDTETASSPSKRGGGSAKLVRKEGGLDDSVFIAVKEIGRDLYRGLPTDERIQKLEFMLDKLQNEIDQELEHNNCVVKEEREASEARRKAILCAALAKSGERLQALTLLMIHYRAGIEDIESLENSCLAQPRRTAKYEEEPAGDAGEGEEDVPMEVKEILGDPADDNPADALEAAE